MIDRAVSADRGEPRGRVGGNAIRAPLLERNDEGFLQDFLGELDIAQDTHQRCDDPRRLTAEHVFYNRVVRLRLCVPSRHRGAV